MQSLYAIHHTAKQIKLLNALAAVLAYPAAFGFAWLWLFDGPQRGLFGVRPYLVAGRGGLYPRLRPGAHKDTLNLGPPKIEADPQLVLVRRAGHAALSAIKQAIQLRSESTQLRQRAGSGARP